MSRGTQGDCVLFWRARPSRNRIDTNRRKRGQGLYVLMILTFSFDLLAGEEGRDRRWQEEEGGEEENRERGKDAGSC
jgi:hypothetical protein